MSKTIIEPNLLYDGEVQIDYYPTSHHYKLVENGKKRNLLSVTGITRNLDKSQPLLKWAIKVVHERGIELLGKDKNKSYTYDDIVTILNLAKEAPEEAKQKAAGIGDYVHKFAEEYSKDLNEKAAYDRVIEEYGQPSDVDKPKIDAGVVGLVKWLNEVKAEIVDSEQIVYSKKFDYTGRFDAIIKIDGKTYLVDYKTSNGIYDEHYYQASAYLKAKEEELGVKYDGALIVAIVKEDKDDKQAGDILPEFRSRGDLVKDFAAFKGLIPVTKRSKELKAEWYAKNR